MRRRHGWRCDRCGVVALEYRRKPQGACPECKTTMTGGEESVTVVNLDANDFPKKPRHHPDQTYLFDDTEDLSGSFIVEE